MIERVEIKSYEVEVLENPGCNNGNYPRFTAITVNGDTVEGVTCACQRGCARTTQIWRSNDGRLFLCDEWD